MAPRPLDWRIVRPLTLDPLDHPRGLTHLAAGSGLVRLGAQVVVVADDEHHLARFDLEGDDRGQLFRLFDGDLPADPAKRKKAKRDLEVLVHLPPSGAHPWGCLIALGSGSRPKRKTAAVVSLDATGAFVGPPVMRDLAPIYDDLAPVVGDLNIEGAFVLGDSFVMLQRGNKGAFNATICFRLADIVRWAEGESHDVIAWQAIERHDLGEIDGVRLCFTDGAALSDGGWVFSAVAERTDDSYADGPFAGSAVGFVDDRGRVTRIEPVAEAWKIEGIEARTVTGRTALLLVTDADDPAIASLLLEATV